MAGGEALDMALGLLRAPTRRMQLAARPLPSGMTTLLEVAGGSHAAANAAAAATGATPEELLEASRFFVQQVLFTEGADAYRVLGAMPDAPQSTLVTHHRLLQRWLHPDRSNGEAWDSAYSTRVNQAWSRVRTARARQAYDDALVVVGSHDAPSPAPYDSSAVGGVAPTYATDASDLTSTSIAGLRDSPANARDGKRFRTLIGPTAVAAVAVACIALLWLVQQRDQRTQAELLHPVPRATAANMTTAPPPPAAPAIPQQHSAFEALSAVVLPAAPEPAPAEPAPAEPATAEPAAPDHGFAIDSAALPDNPDYADASTLEAFGVIPEPASNAPVLEILSVSELSPATAGMAVISSPSPGSNPSTAAVPQPATVHAAVEQPLPEAPDPLQLLRQAEDTVAQAALYLASDGSHIPPIWNDFSTEAVAAEARAGLAMRFDGNTPGRINLDSPKWRMGDEHAVLQAGYRTGDAHSPERGELRIEMTRREQRWLVTRVHMEPSD
ncbi:J domain-containing protein [Luteimonas sp. A277]